MLMFLTNVFDQFFHKRKRSPGKNKYFHEIGTTIKIARRVSINATLNWLMAVYTFPPKNVLDITK